MNWWRDSKFKIKLQEPLKNHTTFKVGGSARYFAEPKDIKALKLLLNYTKRYDIPVLIIGAGSNILVSDKGLDALVLRLSSPFFKKISFQGNHIKVGSGAMLSQIISSAQRRGLSGLEFLTGIPGTVGGALAMNAGIEKASIWNLVEEVTVMDYNNRIKNLSKEDIKFGYRKSSLSKFIILNAHLRLIAKEKREIINRIKRHINYRLKTQDISKPCAGCIFKNPKGVSAGRLIDLCGLKGVKIGGAYISRRHGNFILNLGTATLADVLGLMDLAKKRVKKKFNINLEPEIIIWQ
jgi:UDP-N-acetylmuramate dehydrogenase